jgi:hypothetical protein
MYFLWTSFKEKRFPKDDFYSIMYKMFEWNSLYITLQNDETDLSRGLTKWTFNQNFPFYYMYIFLFLFIKLRTKINDPDRTRTIKNFSVHGTFIFGSALRLFGVDFVSINFSKMFFIFQSIHNNREPQRTGMKAHQRLFVVRFLRYRMIWIVYLLYVSPKIVSPLIEINLSLIQNTKKKSLIINIGLAKNGSSKI